MQKFNSRKFLITMLVLIGIILCVVTNTKIDPDLASLLKWIVGLYFTSNVTQKAVAKITGTTTATTGAASGS